MKKIILFVLCLLTGLMFINAGLDKFLHYMPMPKNMPPKMLDVMGAFMKIGWLMPLVGAFELIGGLLLVIPRTRPLGAIILVPILAGILLDNIAMATTSGIVITLILVAVVAWVIIENRAKYLPMVSK